MLPEYLSVYLELGFDHILDLSAYDHILFVVTLCAVFQLKQWRKILILVTAFTLGHSLTLALSTLNVVNVNPVIVEYLIPVTIIITAVYNLISLRVNKQNLTPHYVMTAFFGLIHGLGFSNYLKAILGGEESILGPLLFFNIGVEMGQLMIVALFMFISYLLVTLLKLPQRYFTIGVSILAILVSIYLMIQL